MLKRLATRGGQLYDIVTKQLALVAGDLAGICAFIMASIITLDITLRYVFNAPFKWVCELSSYLLLVIVFLGLAYTHKERGHINADVLLRRLPARVQKWATVLNSIAFLICTAFLFKINLGFLLTSVKFGTTSQTSWDVPLAPWQAIMPLGLIFLGLLIIRDIYIETKVALGKQKGRDSETKS